MKLTNTTDWNTFICNVFEFFNGNYLSSLDIFSFIYNTVASFRYFLSFCIFFINSWFFFHFIDLVSKILLSYKNKNNK